MEKEKAQYLSGIVLSGGGNLLGMAASLLTIMIAARALSQEELGAYFLVMVVVQFAALLGDIGLRNTAIKSLSLLTVESADFIQTARYLLTVTLTTAAIAGLAVWFAIPFLVSLWSYQDFQQHVAFVIPIAFLTTGLQIGMSLLVGAKQFVRLSALSAGIEILRAILSTGGILIGLGISSLLWGMIISRIVGIGVIWGGMPALFAPAFRHSRSTELLKFGGWLYGGSLMSVIMVRASDLILTTYVGTAALAVYSAAMQIPAILQRIFESIRPAVLGYVSAQQSADGAQQVATVRIATAILSVCAIILILLSEPLMTVLYSEKYKSGVSTMQALSVWIAFAIVNYLFSTILIGNGESRKAFLLTIPQLFMIVICTGLLVPRYEGFGAAMALIATGFLGNLVGAWMLAGNDRHTRHTLLMVTIRAAAPLLLLLIAAFYTQDSFLLLAGFAAIATGLLIATKTIRSSDIRAVRPVISGMIGRMRANRTAA